MRTAINSRIASVTLHKDRRAATEKSLVQLHHAGPRACAKTVVTSTRTSSPVPPSTPIDSYFSATSRRSTVHIHSVVRAAPRALSSTSSAAERRPASSISWEIALRRSMQTSCKVASSPQLCLSNARHAPKRSARTSRVGRSPLRCAHCDSAERTIAVRAARSLFAILRAA
eukprot:scaffold923_cov256-Pinguiococcus_pyrenoidosus.AAC.24